MMNKYDSHSTTEKKALGGTYRKANIALGLSVLGLAVAFPFQSNFWGGLITSGCSAALVGGLADWFAVNALFRRPLGVPAGRVFRTEIIPRNRERIFEALRSMVENELLSHEALKNKVKTYDFSAPALGIWNALDRESFQSILTQTLQQFQESFSLRAKDLAEEGRILLEEESIKEKHAFPLLVRAFLISLESQEGKKALATLLNSLSNWVQETEVHLWLTHWLEKSIQRYTQNPSRKLLALFLPEPSKLAQNIQNQLAEYLLQEQTLIEVIEWLKLQVKRLPEGSLHIITEDSESPLDIRQGNPNHSEPSVFSRIYYKLTESLTDNLLQKLQAPESAHALSKQLLKGIEDEIGGLSESAEKRQHFNRYLQSVLIPFLENKHPKIGEIVQEGLEKYSNEMLVDLIESKAGDDLQMIRINGSIVGGIAGMLIYLISQIVV